jgi:predicted ribonuclease YlaK
MRKFTAPKKMAPNGAQREVDRSQYGLFHRSRVSLGEKPARQFYHSLLDGPLELAKLSYLVGRTFGDRFILVE